VHATEEDASKRDDLRQIRLERPVPAVEQMQLGVGEVARADGSGM
jgi:hypothetical protein